MGHYVVMCIPALCPCGHIQSTSGVMLSQMEFEILGSVGVSVIKYLVAHSGQPWAVDSVFNRSLTL